MLAYKRRQDVGSRCSLQIRSKFAPNSHLVLHPVLVPLVEGEGIVDTNILDALDLHASLLELVDVPVQGSGGVSAGENVLSHENAPGYVLPVGSFPKSSDLHVEGAVIL